VEPKLGTIQRAGNLVGCEAVDQAGNGIGRVIDWALDLETGKLALVMIEPSQADGLQLIALPARGVSLGVMTLKANVPDSKIEKSPRIKLDGEPAKLTRAWGAKVYQHFGGDPLWKEGEPMDRSLTLASTLMGTPVTNTAGMEVGRIEDLALVLDQGVVGYLAVTMSGDDKGKLYPIPLSAFVVEPQTKKWILELPADILAGSPSFDANQWPDRIDRGWVEYVHVRYGRSPFAGVRKVLHADNR
jgi:sporulation protein YlmC with PRC-barrel domain